MATAKRTTTVRRDQIARAALRLLARRGVAALNVAALARAVGLVPSAIYRHFPGKDAILELVLTLIRTELLALLEAAKTGSDDPLEALRRLLHRHIQLLQTHEAIPLLVFSDRVYSGPARRRAHLHDTLQAYLAGIADLVQRGQARQQFRADLDPGATAVMFLGLVQPAVILWHLSRGQFDVTRQTEYAWRVFASALGAAQLRPPTRRAHSAHEPPNPTD